MTLDNAETLTKLNEDLIIQKNHNQFKALK